MQGLDPAQDAEFVSKAKRQVRSRISALRGAYPAGALAERSRLIVERIFGSSLFTRASGIATFWPLLEKNEVDLRPVVERGLALGKRIYCPFLDVGAPDGEGRRTRTTGFRQVQSAAELADRGQKFFEPLPSAEVAAQGSVELVLVPALAISLTGHRIGYGAGYYDSTLPDVRPPAVAMVVGFEFQLLAELPVLPHDIACDVIVTDQRYADAVRPTS